MYYDAIRSVLNDPLNRTYCFNCLQTTTKPTIDYHKTGVRCSYSYICLYHNVGIGISVAEHWVSHWRDSKGVCYVLIFTSAPLYLGLALTSNSELLRKS